MAAEPWRLWVDLFLQPLWTCAGGRRGAGSAAAGVTIDAATTVKIDSDSGDISFEDNGTAQLAIDMDGTAGEIIIQQKVAGDDLVFKAQGGDEVLRLKSEGSVEVKDNLDLKSDASVLTLGVNNQFVLTHANAKQRSNCCC